jgi:hypothetical protein
MKIWKLLLAVSLVATWGLMSAAGAKADGLPPDPHFVVNQCPPGSTSPGCDANTIVIDPSDASEGEITEAYSSVTITEPWANNAEGAGDLLSLVLTITGAPEGLLYQCTSNVFPDCSIQEPPSICDPVAMTCTLTVVFQDVSDNDTTDTADGPIPGSPLPGGDGIFCNNSGVGGVLTDCPGFIGPGQVVSVAIVTPEPSTILLLAAGLIPLLGFGRKRWMGAR